MKCDTVTKTKQSGFTLVELAIVLMIIGLLIGGILRGQEMLKNAQIAATIKDVNGYFAATASFQDAYGQLPGDMSNATVRIPNCNAASFCGNGNGNNRIGRNVTAGPATPAAFDAAVNQASTIAAPEVETSYYWKHLAIGGYISGIDPGSDPSVAVSGATHPNARASGVFVVFYSAYTNPALDVGVGHNIRLQRDTNATASVAGGSMPLTPQQAYSIDIKLDDGFPDQGFITADYEGTGCDPAGRYSTTTTSNVCNIQFYIK
jgi:prepilin-type N-terminal cleavage/methylation domain-containing protein